MKFRDQVRVPWADLDSGRRIHFTALLRYFERAEGEFFRFLGLPPTVIYSDPRYGMPRVHAECDYFAPVGLDDLLSIEVSVERVGRSSLTLRFDATKDEQAVAQGRITMVRTDLTAGKSVPLPEELVAALRQYGVEGES